MDGIDRLMRTNSTTTSVRDLIEISISLTVEGAKRETRRTNVVDGLVCLISIMELGMSGGVEIEMDTEIATEAVVGIPIADNFVAMIGEGDIGAEDRVRKMVVLEVVVEEERSQRAKRIQLGSNIKDEEA